jgi:hypothetical protein
MLTRTVNRGRQSTKFRSTLYKGAAVCDDEESEWHIVADLEWSKWIVTPYVRQQERLAFGA